MRLIALIAASGLLATGANAQVLGGQVGGTVGGAVGGVGQIGSNVNGAARVDPALPDASRVVDRATRTADSAARDTPTVRVKAGASIRVARGTRCYYAEDDYYSDPAYRGGYYYCERTGPAVGASVRSQAPR